MKIMADSSANLTSLSGADFASVPLKIHIGGREFSDTAGLDVGELMEAMHTCTGRTCTACPGIGEWMDAFGDAEEILTFVLTGKLSGCYDAAAIAASEYMEEHPGRRVAVFDTLTTGPELELIVEKGGELAAAGLGYDEACASIAEYRRSTHLAFVLTSLDNFARNGRVNPALAKLVRLLKIHIVGRGSEDGDLEPLNKCRGMKKGVAQLWDNMRAAGYTGGRVRIRHTENEGAAAELARLIRQEYPEADVRVGANRGLCAYYAEHGGMLVGFEGASREEGDGKNE